MEAYSVHSVKEITRKQLQSAVRHHSTAEQKKLIAKADKKQLLLPLASALIREGIIKIKEGANSMGELTVTDVCKEKSF